MHRFPDPTPVFRLVHLDNLEMLFSRAGLWAPNHTPDDGLRYRTIHNADVQARRSLGRVPCGPKGVVHDYVPFYFGYLSPMLFQLKTGWVEGYDEGQEPLVYLVARAQRIAESGRRFVFSDGHGVAAFTSWYDDLVDLDKVDWGMVYQRYWRDESDDPDRQRRKQAEFLVHRFCGIDLIDEIAVMTEQAERRVLEIIHGMPIPQSLVVAVRRQWYY